MTSPGDGALHDDAAEGEQPVGYKITYRVFEKRDAACADREGGHTGEKKTWTDHCFEDTPLDCLNALLYDLRGVKSRWELAYIDEIEPLWGDADD